MQTRELTRRTQCRVVWTFGSCIVVTVTMMALSSHARIDQRGKTASGRTVAPLLGATDGEPRTPPRVTVLAATRPCTISGHQECDVYEDWIEVDGVRRVTGRHLENCRTVIDAIRCEGDEGGAGGGRNPECRDVQCCLRSSQDEANRRKQAILEGQRNCMASLGGFANQQCTGLVTPMSWTDVDTNTFNAYRGRYCTAAPRGNIRVSEEVFQRRYDAWHRTCQQDIAKSLTADQRSRCVDDLRRGNGGFWNKFTIHAGPHGTFGWDIGNDQNQGFEAACNQQTTQLLLESNKKKTEDDIACHRRPSR